MPVLKIIKNNCSYISINVFVIDQCGFRKGYYTLGSLFVLFNFFEILKNKKNKMFCAFIDFEKSFDKVWRDGLWYKLLLNNMGKKFSDTAKYCNWLIIFWIHLITFVFVNRFYITYKPVIRNNARFENNIK
jgi:hypothetical protein